MASLVGPVVSTESSINHNSGIRSVSVSTMCGFESNIPGSDISPVLTRSIVELDSDQAIGSNKQVRILNFQIDLELPMDDSEHEPNVVKENFPFPDTETVGFLKQHFIDCRLTELIQLATSPELESKITECSKANLLKHLVLESSGSHSFADNSALLRTLHLPKCIKLQAKLNPDPLPDSSSDYTTNQQNEPVKLHISVYETSKSKRTTTNIDDDHNITDLISRSERNRQRTRSRSPYAYHYLRLPCHSFVSQIRNDLHRITGIPVSHQLWSVTPKHNIDSNHPVTDHTPSNEVLNLLVTELNRHQQQLENEQSNDKFTSPKYANPSTTITTSTDDTVFMKRKSSHDNLTLADCGLKSGDVCELCGFDDDFEKADDEEDEEDEDYDMDYHYSSDELLDQTDDKKITPWNQPLIPDDPNIEDPELATQQFCIVFLQRYCSDGVTMSPPFCTCSLDTALSLSVGTNQVCDRKPLFIYLHNDNSVACHVFCQQVLCSPGLLRFLTDHEFSLWPWDVTRARAKERLLGWLEVKLPNLSRIITPLPVDSYPVLAMIVKLSGQLEVLCIVMGTGIVKMWPLDHFPPLINVHPTTTSSHSTVLPIEENSSIGSLKADVIVAELWQAYTTYLEVLEPERATEREIIARRRVLEEQEAAYEESLRRDQEKLNCSDRPQLDVTHMSASF
ncbi:FAS-associated factor 1 [Schistosoma japonicum]|nr:FAS-associated factor 1 [Schistosoma japonicum]